MRTIYKSDLKELESKDFSSVEELEKAEAEINEKLAKKQKEVEARKSDSAAVKSIIEQRYKAELEARKAKKEALKVYTQVCSEQDEKVKALMKEEKAALEEFCKKYGGFHDTITIDDVTYRYDYSVSNNEFDPFKKLIELFF